MAGKQRCTACSSPRRPVVWRVDDVTLCNRCFIEWSENVYDITDHRVVRLTMNEKFFEDSSRRHHVMGVTVSAI